MENNEAEIKKKRTKRVVLFSLGTLALGTLTFFGIKLFKNHKKKNSDDTENKTGDELDTETGVQASTHIKSNTGLPSPRISDAFPLRLGSKGDKVRSLQQALISAYGAGVLANYGADGQFGKELASALKSKGYGVPLQEADYNKITGQKKQQTPPAPLLTFDPSVVAKGIYFALTAKDFNATITLLKGIKNTTDYSLVSEQLKNYRVGGVRQTLVNATLNTFTESSQKAKVQDTLKNIGLKYDGKKWTIS